jgi:hypothetical protein
LRTLRVLLWALGGVVALPLLGIALLLFLIEVLYPHQLASLQDEAAAWNKENWETGFALRITVSVSSDEVLGGASAGAIVHCYEKRFARAGGLKGPPDTVTLGLSQGPLALELPLGQNAIHVTPLDDVCGEALRDGGGRGLPQVTESRFSSFIVASDRSFECFLGTDTRTTAGRVTRPRYLAVERVALRDVLVAGAYEALAYPYTIDGPRQPPPLRYYWWAAGGGSCWRAAPIDPCNIKAEATCGRPLD